MSDVKYGRPKNSVSLIIATVVLAEPIDVTSSPPENVATPVTARAPVLTLFATTSPAKYAFPVVSKLTTTSFSTVVTGVVDATGTVVDAIRSVDDASSSVVDDSSSADSALANSELSVEVATVDVETDVEITFVPLITNLPSTSDIVMPFPEIVSVVKAFVFTFSDRTSRPSITSDLTILEIISGDITCVIALTLSVNISDIDDTPFARSALSSLRKLRTSASCDVIEGTIAVVEVLVVDTNSRPEFSVACASFAVFNVFQSDIALSTDCPP
jgi:hypothetical protein